MGKWSILITVNEGMNRRAINCLGEVNEKSAWAAKRGQDRRCPNILGYRDGDIREFGPLG